MGRVPNRRLKNDEYFKLKMATISRRKIYDIPEEVGMDIVEAIDMFKIVTLKEKKISKIKRPKIKKNNSKEEKVPEKFKVPKSVIQKLNEEFLQELRNEIRNQPDFSSVTLSNFLRGTSRSRNVLFQENILFST